jgi:hypothetical protein
VYYCTFQNGVLAGLQETLGVVLTNGTVTDTIKLQKHGDLSPSNTCMSADLSEGVREIKIYENSEQVAQALDIKLASSTIFAGSAPAATGLVTNTTTYSQDYRFIGFGSDSMRLTAL